MLLRENVPLAPLTTIGVGGPSRYFVEAQTAAEVAEAVTFANTNHLPLFVLGGGSNLVVSDSGWPGLTLKISIKGIQERTENGKAIFQVGAGEDWDRFVALTVERNCAGIECLSGIPGSVGGTPVQNVGAYGQEVSQTIESVLAFDLRDSQLRELCNEACSFAYRTSLFNTAEKNRFIILEVTYALQPGGAAHVDYRDLKTFFAESGHKPTLAATRDAVLKIRSDKGMLITPGDPDCRSAGSFFKNPVLSPAQYQNLTALPASQALQIPTYPAANAQHKVSAAWLVEHSGFPKGYSTGRVGISTKHALAIVNKGGATAADVISLKSQIQGRARELWGIDLQPEPEFVGF
ncbi:MAG TPA: UDP-N-acetylmuramate dehydrogenase [Terriglobales bacterium]